jgi:hypothetical protein
MLSTEVYEDKANGSGFVDISFGFRIYASTV